MLDTTALNMSAGVNILLVLLMLSVLITDATKKKIYNIQTYPAMLGGLALGCLLGSWQGLWASFLGLVVGMALLFVFYLVGGIGAGDVKLLGAIGALKGATFVVWTLYYTALIGGAMALALIIWKGMVRQTLGNIVQFIRNPLNPPVVDAPQYLPYGVAISLGCLCGLLIV